ncbi:uncharacterized protein LOC131530377 isoform X2 [Onychostoma macrolepis]|uniref:uncharacterized protein LOC131530377 isoform X2 n=1 Tax=Onychostoma macrolepis TaxID=369639 RepID=UPI00272BA84E|nr:uncharacterized protein LOC131530377 isoform X2 [Onychostoma macrolepis]
MSAPDRNTNVTERASTSEEKSDEMVDKRGKTNSVVWKWFGYLRSDKLQVSACCKMCRRVVPTSSGNTSNLFHHLKQFHPIEHSESQKMRHHKSLSQQRVPQTTPPSSSPTPVVSKEKPMQQTIAAFMPYDKQSKRHKDITKAVTNFFAKDMMPFTTVEDVGFRKMISIINPRCELPGRKYFSRAAIPALYGEVRERVEEQLKSVSYFATTADLWSSRTSEPYLSLTVHFIDQDWKLVSLCLQTVYFPEDHTGESIAASWGLREDRQVCITTDSGTSIIKAAELNRWTRLQCFGHRLNSAIGVFGVDPDGVKTVIEGDSLTVQTGFTEMQKDGLTEWKFNNTNIATINKGTGKVEYSDDKLMKMFSGRLNLDQAGFLTIWNIRIKHSGEYKVESTSSVGTKSKTFKVIVEESPLKSVEDKDEIKVLSATKGSSETLHTDAELQKHDLILWRFGAEGSLIAKGDTEDNHTAYYDGDDGRFRGRLEMDSKTGSLTITDLETEHTGEFRLKIISDRRIVFKRFTVTVSGLSPGAVAGICIGVLLIAAAAVAAGVMIYCRSDHFKLKNLMSKVSKQLEQMSKMTKQLEQMTKTNEKDLAKISVQINKMDEVNVSGNEKQELYGKLKLMSEDYEKALPKISKQLARLREQKIPERLFELSEQVNQLNDTETSQQEILASSQAFLKGSSMEDIYAAAGWSSPSTFIKFYSLDVRMAPGSRVLYA